MIYGKQRRKFLPFGRKASVELVGRRIGSQRNVEDSRFSGRCDVANHAASYWRERPKVKMGNAITGIMECEKATGHIWVRVTVQLEDHRLGQAFEPDFTSYHSFCTVVDRAAYYAVVDSESHLRCSFTQLIDKAWR
jgi:hypothetical protein